LKIPTKSNFKEKKLQRNKINFSFVYFVLHTGQMRVI